MLASGESADTQRLDRRQSPAFLYTQQASELFNLQLTTDRPFSHRLLTFFSNHFSISANNSLLRALSASYQREAIAPYLASRFSQMLIAVVRHPAMLVYLNNERSIGPDSRVGKKRGLGINENLAREILELHTLGVEGGYQLADIQALAQGLTGWSISRKRNSSKEQSGFIFRKGAHQPGSQRLLGVSYSDTGEQQAIKMLEALANHPATALHVCHKLARHFVADQPDRHLVAQMVNAWQQHQGRLDKVLEAMLRSPIAWQTRSQKYLSGREFFLYTARALGLQQLPVKQVISGLKTLGQQPFAAISPKGYGDSEDKWLSPSALLTRINWLDNLVKRSRYSSEQLLAASVAGPLSDESLTAVQRAESRQQALSLLLLSPEFSRR